MIVLPIYLAIGSVWAAWGIFRILRGDFDEMFSEESLELIKQPYNLSTSFLMTAAIWPYLFFLMATKGFKSIKFWCFPSFGWIRIGRKTHSLPAWWPWRIGMLISFWRKPPADTDFLLGLPYPSIPGRIAYAIIKGDDSRCVWAGHWSLENAKKFRSNLDELITQVEGFNSPKTEEEQHG